MHEPTAATGPLDGLRVLDLSRVLAGPYATMMLGDLGADVLKVESPSGDDTRRWTPPANSDGMSTYFASVNRNKRSVVLDLKDQADRQRVVELATGADVLVQNLRPGTMVRYGLDHATLSALNPGLIYVSVSGFGEDTGADLPGYDLLAQAMGGLMSITGDADSPPTKVGVALVDVLTGMNAVIGTFAALRTRELDGIGQHVQVNLLSSLLSALVNQASSTLVTGTDPGRLGNDHPSIAPYATYTTADQPLVVAVGNDAQFAALARVLNRRDWVDDPRFATNSDRVRYHAELRVELEAVLAGAPAQEWTASLVAAGVPAGPVNSVSQAMDLAASLGLDPVVRPTRGKGPPTVRNPLFMSRHQPVYRTAPPGLGENQEQVGWRVR